MAFDAPEYVGGHGCCVGVGVRECMWSVFRDGVWLPWCGRCRVLSDFVVEVFDQFVH